MANSTPEVDFPGYSLNILIPCNFCSVSFSIFLFPLISQTLKSTSNKVGINSTLPGSIINSFKNNSKKGRNLNCVPQNTTEAVQHEYNVGGLFVWAVGEDDKNSSQVKFSDKRKKSYFEKKNLLWRWDLSKWFPPSACAPAWSRRSHTFFKGAVP